MIKNIIFDLGNVIINYNQEKIIKHFTQNKDEHDYIIVQIFRAPEWQMMDLGTLTNQEAANIINQRNNFRYEDLTDEFLNNWYKVQNINRDVVEFAKKLYEKGYKSYVLSNMANSTFEFFKNDEFFKMCDGIIISAHEHIKKPDRKVFEILMSRYNLKPHECIFIDDDDTGRSYNTANEMEILGRRVLPNNVQDIEKMLNENNIII